MTRHDPASPHILPDDEHNRALVGHVHPPDWVNPSPPGRYNLVVIGAGSAGLVTAAGAAGLGARVALVERHLMGGDCLNVGCVPSKALIRSARAAADARRAGPLGVRVTGDVEVDFAAVTERMRRLRASIAPHDAAARFRDLGVDVYLGDGRFVAPDGVEVGGRQLEFRRAVVATGRRPTAPPVPGLAEAGYLTNETIFELTELPPRLAVIGAGPIGLEMAQCFARFGSEVTVIERAERVLPRDEPDAAAVVADALRADGVTIACGAELDRVSGRAPATLAWHTADGAAHTCTVDAILVAAGRTPNLESLGLDAAGVELDARGELVVDDRLRTTNKRIYAAGDVAFAYQFTHAADATARLVIANALFHGRGKASRLTIPWATYTDPEVAHIGLDPEQARARGVEIDTWEQPLSGLDRAILDGETEGFVRVYTRKGKDTIVGATIVAHHAGDLVSHLAMAMNANIGLGTIASTVFPYPTQAEAIKRTADAWNRTRLKPWVAKLFGHWFRWTR